MVFLLARTPLAGILQNLYAAAQAGMEGRISKKQVIFLKNNYQYQTSKQVNGSTERKPRIVIIGAGLSGLTCAYRLKAVGISSEIYEASGRVGGRCWTRRDFFKEGQIVERGGELIDTSHHEIQKLAEELGLEMDNLITAQANDTKPFYFFNGKSYSFEEAVQDFAEIYPKLQSDLIEVGEETLYYRFTQRGFELDQMSIVDYINEIVPGGIQSRLGKLLSLAYTIENGAAAEEQSALNLLYLLGFAQKDTFQIFGDSDERYRIKGGNDQLPQMLAEKLQGQIHCHCELIQIEQSSKGEIRLTFRNRETEWEVKADKVILTLPFKILKTIDYKNAGFRPLKIMAIKELGMGVNTKLHSQFFSRHWCEIGNNGETFADTGYQNTFESSRAQQGKSGILVGYLGADTAAKKNAITEAQVNEATKNFLDKLEPVLQKSKSNWNGLSTLDHWLSNQWSKGSYSYRKVGQFTQFAGIEGEREGNIFFAGEHTSIYYQGYLNGAVETGERAAHEIMNDLGFHK